MNEEQRDPNLGKKATDIITGFTGVIIGKIQYLTGCDNYGLCPPMKSDGTVQPAEWFDVTRVEIVEDSFTELKQVTKRTGGPNRDVPR